MGRITASRKQLKPDPKFGSVLASKFVNCLMNDGKKSVALEVFYDALDLIKKKVSDQEPIEVFHQAVENVKAGQYAIFPLQNHPLAQVRRYFGRF